ncbi:phage tail spike protein [Ligilactobacillus murinus]|uniref:phage tail spike protein n=1 Tax=Ligilactobacillus murinus TaxID=1622 RepID=UPI00096CEB88|nr:phage tail spike protein [Ligilactobacillus murinus]
MIMYLLDKQQNIIQAISDGIIEAKMTEEINTADKLSFSLVQNKRLANSIYFVCIPANRGDAFLMFKIISESVKDDRIEYTCIESAYDELKSYAYIKDVRPQDKTASEMLRIALNGTRWEVGYSEETVCKRTNFYYISTLEAIQKVVELFKVELTFTVVIDPITNRIVRRQVNLYSQQGERTGKRFEYGSNLLSVTREESSEDLVTALVGRGKGEQLDDGDPDTPDGYGRRIMFTDVVWSKANGHPTDKPAGQDYVEDKEATKLYGFDDGKPRIGIAVFEDIEDVNQLINATWAALQVAKRPKVSFKASALDIGDLGLGDTVAIIRHELNIEYFTRVYKVEHDLLDKNNNVIELGDDFSEKSLTNYVASVKEAQEETSRVANIALTSANGKNKNFYSNVKPTIAAEGDNLFLDLGNGETEYYVWRNGNWELILSTAELNTTKKEVDKALSDIEDVRSQADQAFNNAKNAQYSADSVYRSFMDLQKNSATQDTVDYYYKELADSISAKYNQVHNEIQSSFDGLMPTINDAINNATDAKIQLNNALSEVGRIDYSMKALQSSYANLDGEISQTKQTANQISTKLANAQGDITKLVTKAGKLEQQLLSKVDTTLFENFREATSRELKQRLTATDLNGYVKSTELVQTANGIRASVSAVDGKLNDLKIGGANLIPNSNASETGAVAWTGTRLFTHPFYFNSTKNMFNVDNSTTLITAAVSQRFAIKPNTQYTLSYVGFMSTNSGGYNIFLRGRKGNIDKESQFIQGGRLSASSAEYKHVTFTTGDIDNAELAFNVDGSTNGNVSNFFFNEVMLVEGNKDLRWGPAPKDVENRYASLNIEVDKINAVVANKADRSYVEQRANEIGSIVANKADMSYVNQKADQWQLALTNLQIGGTNLVPLTNQGTRDLYVENKFGVASFTEKNIYGVRGILVKNTRPAPANGWFVIGKNVDLSKFKPDTDYVISFNLRGDTSIKAHAIVDVRGANSQNSISTSDPGYDLDLKAGKVLRVEKKFHTLASFTDVGQVLYINCIELSRVKNLEVWDFKIEEGNKATPWAPAPEDATVAITAVKNELNTAINLRVQKNELLSQINLQAGHTLIQSKKIYLDAETVAFSGKAFIPNAAIVDLRADKITAGTLNASKVSIINLDVNRLTGNKTEFVKSFWRSAYGNYVNIDYSGMRVTYGNTTTEFNSYGMEITAVGESIGGIGWQGMKNMPPNYQGLTFWLDGGGDYMAWAARDSGNYSMNPVIKMAWYRKEWLPPGQHAGFKFSDPVTFHKELRIWGNIYGQGAASGGDTHLHFQTFSDGSAGLVNDLNSGFVIKNNGDIGLMRNSNVVWLGGKSIANFNSDGTASSWTTI